MFWESDGVRGRSRCPLVCAGARGTDRYPPRMTFRSLAWTWFAFFVTALAGCECSTPTDDDAGSDAGHDAGSIEEYWDVPPMDTPPDVPSPDDDAGHDAGEPDARPSCLESGHEAGDRYPAMDTCNFCECHPDGSVSCTDRTCFDALGGCEYEGTAHDYGARFPSIDGCNECVCAASGLACTRRERCAPSDEGAILLETPDQQCGEDPEFTPAAILARLPSTDFVAPFLYDRDRDPLLYPEVLPDTNVRIRIVFDQGFMVCRIPSPEQPALDLQITVEWITEDGAFDEGFQAYLRKNNFGFVDSYEIVSSLPLGGLGGSYVPVCALDPGGYSFAASIEPDGHATGATHRVCETDLSLVVGTFDRPAP